MNAETQRDAEKTQRHPLPAPTGSPSLKDLATALRVMRWMRKLASEESPSWLHPITILCGLLRQFVEIAKERQTEKYRGQARKEKI